MSRLNDLLYQLRAKEPALAQDLEREFAALADLRAFGLNFERHVPEAVELPGRKVRKGDKAHVLPPRGKTPTKPDERLWRVIGIDRTASTASLEALETTVADEAEGSRIETAEVAVEDLVVVAEFRDPIYPGLVSTGKVERGGDKPFHTVINAENYHALETLLFTHRGKVDAIYIDPPYNTGAKDWKYNNDYVEGEDLYRHSKWLAMIERRLLLAKELLNPEHSVLMVAIDEKEYLRLGLLLEQVLPGVSRQMATVVTNPNGVARGREMARVEEYLFFLFIGDAGPSLVADSMLDSSSAGAPSKKGVRWEWLLRGGNNSRRSDRPNLFYPIFIDPKSRTVAEVGEALPVTTSRDSIAGRADLATVWPLRTTGEEASWQLSSKRLRELLDAGHARVGEYDARNDRWSLLYLGPAQVRRIDAGELAVTGRRDDGSIIVEAGDVATRRTPKTVWNRSGHKAGEYGSMLLRRLIGNRSFAFPKSLYVVEDALRIAVGDDREALVLDFFAGSGTTAHAVARLNRQDGGRRQSIMVTNNEVSAAEADALRNQGHLPGDPEWEALGIFAHITRPRIEAAVTGRMPDGEQVKGDYKFIDEFPMADGLEENVEFFTLTYEAPLRVASNREFAKIAPLLWMRAGSRGRRIDDVSGGWAVTDSYGVLSDLDQSEAFLKAVAENDDVAAAFIITDEDRLFESVSRELPDHVKPVRLYEAYLRNFEIESGRGAL